MPKSTIRAVSESRIFQCVLYDSRSVKRSIIAYICGADVYWAENFVDLFDRDKVRISGPDHWLNKQLRQLPEDADVYDWRGNLTQTGQVPQPGEHVDTRVPVLREPVDNGDLGEDAIQQG